MYLSVFKCRLLRGHEEFPGLSGIGPRLGIEKRKLKTPFSNTLAHAILCGSTKMEVVTVRSRSSSKVLEMVGS